MKKKSSSYFRMVVEKKFNFLETIYNCKLIKFHKNEWGYEILYSNETTAIKIIYEFREGFIFVMLYQLKDGQFVDNPISISIESILHGYGLDDIVSIRNPAALIKPSYEYKDNSEFHDEEKGLENYIFAIANNLKEYAADVLSGNFEIFKETERLVKERIEKYQ